ncbi:MAG: hypothetical protein M9927_03795 [Anaerolineae bacterium]|nr:hypothetical protein [Anaerolineae bacterium]
MKPAVTTRFLLTALLLSLILLPSSSAQAQPPDPVPLLAALHDQDPTYHAAFSRNDGSWSTQSDDQITRAYARRAYALQAAPGAGLALSLGPIEAADALIEVSVTQTAGAAESAAGLVFRAEDERTFYLFTVTDGQYVLVRFDDGAATVLAPPTADDAIERGEGAYNRLGVAIQGPAIWLFANDTLLAQIDDDAIAQGSAGLAVIAGPGQAAEFAFDDLDLWDLADFPDIALDAAPPAPEPDGAITPAQIDAIRAEEPVFSAGFARDDGAWDTSDDHVAVRSIQRRAYHLGADIADAMAVTLSNVEAADFYLEASVQADGAPESAGGGLVFRAQDADNFYFFTVADGAYVVGRVVEGEAELLVEPTPDDAIERGADAFNRLGVHAQGAVLTLVANDTVLAAVTDETIAAGAAGLIVRTGIDAPAGFIFDDVEVWTVGEVAPAEQAPAVTPRPPVATATPAPSPTATPKPATPTATPTPTPRTYTLDDFEVEWGPLGHLFAVSNARIEQQWMTTQLGQSVESTVLAFDVEAKRQITFGVFMAHFYDAEGKEVGLFSPVIFDPLPDLGWETGMDGTAAVILPIDDLDEIVRIEIKQFM